MKYLHRASVDWEMIASKNSCDLDWTVQIIWDVK